MPLLLKTNQFITTLLIIVVVLSFNVSHSSTEKTVSKNNAKNSFVRTPALTKLIEGIKADDYTLVLQALNEGADYNKVIHRGKDTITLAMSYQKIETIKALIDFVGVDNLRYKKPNRKKSEYIKDKGIPIIGEAFLGLYYHKDNNYYGKGHNAILKPRLDKFYKTLTNYILSKTKNINTEFKYLSKSIRTPLSIAAEYNDLDMVKRLLKMGANPNLPAYNPEIKRTVMPLGAAGKNNNIEILKVLLDNKANVAHPYYSIGSIRDETAFLLIYNAGYDVSRTNFFLSRAISFKWNKLLDLAILRGANIDNFFYDNGDEKSFTPLANAIKYNNLYAYKALLKAGADPCLGEKGAYVMDRLRVIEQPIQDVLPYLKEPMQAAGCEGLLENYQRNQWGQTRMALS